MRVTQARLLRISLLTVVLANCASAAEPPALSELAQKIAQQLEQDQPVRRKTNEETLPKANSADREVLENISRDKTRKPCERIAALALLGSLADARREKAVDDFFSGIAQNIAPFHVHHAERYISPLAPAESEIDQTLLNNETSPYFLKRLFPKDTQFDFANADLPLLVRRAVMGDGMAVAALGRIDRPEAAECLLNLPSTRIGDSGTIRETVFWGQLFYATKPAHRKQLTDWLEQNPEPSRRRARVTFVLAIFRDPAALQPLIDLLASFKPLIKPGKQVRDSAGSVLPPGIGLETILEVCRAWGDPSLQPVIEELLYLGGDYSGALLKAAQSFHLKLDKEKLFAMAREEGEHVDPVLKALTPLLEPPDSTRIAAMLAPSQWQQPGFYQCLIWTKGIGRQVLSCEIRDALIEVYHHRAHNAYEEWALEALAPFKDEKTRETLLEARAKGSGAAVWALATQSDDPWKSFVESVTSDNEHTRDAAYTIVSNYSCREHLPVELTPERKAELLVKLLPVVSKGNNDSPAWMALTEMTFDLIGRPAKHSPLLAEAVVAAVAPVFREELQKEAGMAYRLVGTLNWAKTDDARQLLETAAEKAASESVRESAARYLKTWVTIPTPH
jgi:hypothetical protein